MTQQRKRKVTFKSVHPDKPTISLTFTSVDEMTEFLESINKRNYNETEDDENQDGQEVRELINQKSIVLG